MSEISSDETISFDDFLKVNLVVGKILDAERVSGYKKILRLKVDIGNEIREIASGLALHYNPEDLVGKNIIFCKNLQPKKIGVLVSHGMLLAAEDENGKPIIITPLEDVKSGSKIS